MKKTSQLFQWNSPTGHDAEKHYTSLLRIESGHSAFEGTLSTHASFTIGELETEHKATEFLAKYGCSDMIAKTMEGQIHHFDIAVTSGGSRSVFPWTSQQLGRVRMRSEAPEVELVRNHLTGCPTNLVNRMRRLRVNTWPETSPDCQPHNVHVVRISNVFDDPSFKLYDEFLD